MRVGGNKMKKLKKKLCMLFVVMLMLSTLTMVNTSAFEGGTINGTENSDELAEEKEAEVDSEQNELADADVAMESDDIESKRTPYDTEALIDALKAGVKQGSYLNMADYYTGNVEELEIDFIEGRAHVEGPQILFTTAGKVSFLVKDNTEEYGIFTVEVVANTITQITFDKTEAAIVIGESVDLIISVSEDRWSDDSLSITATYEGTGSVDLEAIADENNANYTIRVHGVSAGSGRIVVDIEESDSTPAVANITILGGTITPNGEHTAQPLGTLEFTNSVPATNDTTITTMYTTMLGTSVLTLGYIYLTKKRNMLKR
jgi:hypothetical protein